MEARFIKNYLEEFKDDIVCFRIENEIFPRWQKQRPKYIYRGVIRQQNVREILPNEVVIEFDSVDPNDSNISLIQDKTHKEIGNLAKVLKKKGVGFHITDHGGKSPHLRTKIIGLDKLTLDERKKYKVEFVKDLLKETGFVEGIIKLDESLLRSNNKIISLELKPHFKKKYNGNLERIIDINNQPYSRVSQQFLRLRTSQEIPQKTVSLGHPSHSSQADMESLSIVFQKWYQPGQRHYVIMALASFLQKFGYTLNDAVFIVQELLKLVQPRDNNEDLFDVKLQYTNKGLDGNPYGPSGMLSLGLGDDAKEAYVDFVKCFREVDL